MKLQNFLIGLGVFALFSIIIFGFINNDGGDCAGVYCENYLNITHDSETNKAISNISTVGRSTESSFHGVSGDMQNFSAGGEEPSESSLVVSALKILINLPKAWIPVANVLRMMEEKFGIPSVFTQWAIASIIIIIILILLSSFLKNPLKS